MQRDACPFIRPFPFPAPRQAFSRFRDRTQRLQPSPGLRVKARRARSRKECCRGKAVLRLRQFQFGLPLHPCDRPCGTGVTSPVANRVSAVMTFTTIAVMLSIPPLLFASAIMALTILSGVALD